MANLLALEWDGREVRVAVARSRPGTVVVEHAFALDLVPRDAGETFADSNLAEQVARELSNRGVRHTDALVAIGRASIELRVLSIPPAPPEELPDMVRFQAMRQFSSLGDDWPLDFVVLDEGEEGTNVLAAAVSPEMVSQVQETCSAGNLSVRSLVLRPFAAASLLEKSGLNRGCRMVVDILADEADLTVVVEGKVAFMRTVRRSYVEDAEKSNRALTGEIRRTMVAAQNQLGGRTVDSIVVCGDAEDHGDLKAQIEERLSLTAELLNPFDNVTHGSGLNTPAHPGRFAPLLGMLISEAGPTGHTIDFLNPRRREEAPTGTKRTALYAGLGAIAALALGFVIWMFWSDQKQQLDDYRAEYDRLKRRENVAKETIDHADEVDAWVTGDINWLDELREVSEEYPEGKEATVTNFVASTAGGNGKILLSCEYAGREVLEQTIDSVSDARHKVFPGSQVATKEGSRFSTQVTLRVEIDPLAEEPDPAETPPEKDASSSKQPATPDKTTAGGGNKS